MRRRARGFNDGNEALGVDGLLKEVEAPFFTACTAVGTSPCPVMKTIGMMVVSKPELGNIPYAPIATEIPFEQIKPVKP